jgi:hypothetical protein
MADRLPPGQGALQNWNNINLNKPEEYSSEFVIDGIRYANVTNVSTGQRQLYFVQSISGARGAPITTTNADGTKTPGGTYDNFNRNNPGKLAAAEAASKQASIKLLSTPGISTPAEAAAIKNSKEFKSTTAGSNAAPGGASGGSTVAANPQLAADTKQGKAGSFVYPANLAEEYQDIIKFNLVEYIPGGIPDASRAGRPPSGKILGTVVLPVPNLISDTNTAEWGADSMNAFQAAGAAFAYNTITGGAAVGMESAEKSLKAAGKDSEGIKDAFGAFFAAAAVQGEGAKLLSRASGQIVNPNLELLFNGPSLRPFNFTFKLAARSEGEGKTILEILRFFKRGMSPIRSESNLFLKSPNTFTIEYQHMGKTNPNIGKIKECALQSVTTSYTPEGQYATFSDGVMVSYSLQMTFSELEPIFTKDYEDSPDGIGY